MFLSTFGCFHQANPSGWAESISGIGVCVSLIPITIHILKAYDESYSKIIRGHKYKDKDNDKDKDTDKVPEKPNICYIF